MKKMNKLARATVTLHPSNEQALQAADALMAWLEVQRDIAPIKTVQILAIKKPILKKSTNGKKAIKN